MFLRKLVVVVLPLLLTALLCFVLPLMEGDLLRAMVATAKGELATVPVSVKPGSAACVVMASGGYPVKYESGKEISGLDEQGQVQGATVYHAGTKRQDGKYLTAGGRVLGVTALGDTLNDALDGAYAAVQRISFEKAHYRHDIGRKAGGKYGN